MKKYIFFLLFILLLNCKKSNLAEVILVRSTSNISRIDSLLEIANSYKLNKKEKLKIIHSVNNDLKKIKKNDTLIRGYYLKLAGRYYNVQEYKGFFESSKKLHELAKIAHDTTYIAKSLGYIGDYFYETTKNDSAFYYYSKAEKAYTNIKESPDLIKIQYNKANILLAGKNYYDCEASIVGILKQAKKQNNYRLIYECNVSLGNTQVGINDYNQALMYFNKSLEVLNNLKKDSQHQLLQAYSYNYIGEVYAKKQEYEKAIQYFNLALKIENLKETNFQLYITLLSNKSLANIKMGNMLNVKKDIDTALLISEKHDYTQGVITTRLVLSEYYLQLHQLDACIENSIKLTEIADGHKIFEDELKGLSYLLKLAPPQKTQYVERYIHLSDSLQNAERISRNKFARIKFETNEIINEKNIIKQERDAYESQRWSIIGVSAFVILFLMFVYITKNQHAKNRKLELEKQQQEANQEIYKLMLNQHNIKNEIIKNEQKRISQELHDGVMSKLTSTRLNLFVLSKRTDPETIERCLNHINGIQDIEKEIRSISHNLNLDSQLEMDAYESLVFELFDNFKESTGVDFKIVCDEQIAWNQLDNGRKIHLYRILQEALQNIYKYASASLVELHIFIVQNSLQVIIKDNGKGFNTKKTRGGIGLKNMKSRAESMHGTCKFSSNEGEGTKITINIPIYI